MVQGHDRAVRSRGGQLGPEVAERLVIQVPVVLARDRGIERDNPQPTPPVGLVDRAAAAAGMKMAAEGVTVIVVARQEDDTRIAAPSGLGRSAGPLPPTPRRDPALILVPGRG